MSASPFTDPALVHGALYAQPDRLAQRTGALHAAKIRGSDAADTIADLAVRHQLRAATLVDIGCGRGATTVRLAHRYRTARLLAVDRSPALLGATAARLPDDRHRLLILTVDFHHLPLRANSVDLAIAAFCLYHSERPAEVLAEIRRCLVPGGRAVMVTKSADSYRDMDKAVAASGLDPDADTRPSLYAAFHSGNAAAITATALSVEQVLHEEHAFRFQNLDHLAAYLVTSPKYHVPPHLTVNPDALAAELRRRLPDTPATTTSTITYVVARRP